MGDVGDYWSEARDDKRFFETHGHWPNQKKCKNCGRYFTPLESWHPRCASCARKRAKERRNGGHSR